MSGADSDPSEEASGRLARVIPWLRWGGLAGGAVGAALRMSAPHESWLRIAGAGLMIAGAVAFLLSEILVADTSSASTFGVRKAPRGEGYSDDGAPILAHRLERLILAGVSGGCAALGIVLLLLDSLDEEQKGTAWPFLVGGTIGLVIAGVWTAAVSRHPREVVLDPPPPSKRPWIAVAVGALIVTQALIPMGYYFGDDIYDERFSWRMFSAVRVYQCNLTAYETQNEVEARASLMGTIHVGWVNTMRRNREAVVRRYLTWRCEEGAEGARVVNRCVSPEGEQVPDVVRRIDCFTSVISDGTEEAGEATP